MEERINPKFQTPEYKQKENSGYPGISVLEDLDGAWNLESGIWIF
ncbi:MAG: hypothetical protein AB1805_11740 [Nitrospirota bacterium]